MQFVLFTLELHHPFEHNYIGSESLQSVVATALHQYAEIIWRNCTAAFSAL